MRLLFLTLLIAIIPTLTPIAGWACPGCSSALGATVGRGFNMSTLFLMAMPFFVIGSIAVGIVVIHQNKRKILTQKTHNQEEE